MYSWDGIKICVDWFKDREHKVKVFVPSDKCDNYGSPTGPIVIDYLQQIDALVKTPQGCNDDLFIINAAHQADAIIVSNDRFRDEIRNNCDFSDVVQRNRLQYIFVDDMFIPAQDPLGRSGPPLVEFLRVGSRQSGRQRIQLRKIKSHQR